MITITEKALEKLQEISEEEGVGHLFVRVKVQGGGCAGMAYDMFFDELVKELDEVLEFKDVKIVIDPLSIHYLEGVEIDYLSGAIESGFKFNNPNIKSSCGCGKSFSA